MAVFHKIMTISIDLPISNSLSSFVHIVLFARIRIMTIQFYPKKDSLDRNSIHTYLNRFPGYNS